MNFSPCTPAVSAVGWVALFIKIFSTSVLMAQGPAEPNLEGSKT